MPGGSYDDDAELLKTFHGTRSRGMQPMVTTHQLVNDELEFSFEKKMKGTDLTGPEVDAAIDEIDAVAQALVGCKEVQSRDGSRPCFDKDEATGLYTLTVSEDSIDLLMSSLRTVGRQLKQLTSTVKSAVETHMTTFFKELEIKRNDEIERLQLSKSKFQVLNEKMEKQQRENELLGKALSPNISNGTAYEALYAGVYTAMEAVMTVTEASRAALYLKSADGSQYLRPVICFPQGVDNELSKDVGLASASTLGTVATTGVGVNISKVRELNTSALASSSAPALKIKNGLCLPIYGDKGKPVGCVLLADKHVSEYGISADEAAEPEEALPSGQKKTAGSDTPGSRRKGDSCFTIPDEMRLLGFCNIFSGIVVRYGVSALLLGAPASIRSDLIPSMVSISSVPKVHERPVPQRALQPDGEKLEGVPHHIPKQLIVRSTQSASTIIAKDLHGATEMVSEETVLEETSGYVRDLENMWRRSLDTITQLHRECFAWEKKLSNKEQELVEQELLLKTLNKQFVRVKSDVARMKASLGDKVKSDLAAKIDGVLTTTEQASLAAFPGGALPPPAPAGESSTALVVVDSRSSGPVSTQPSGSGSSFPPKSPTSRKVTGSVPLSPKPPPGHGATKVGNGGRSPKPTSRS